MKSGAGDDPYATASEDTDETDESGRERAGTSGDDESPAPYLLRRAAVKDGRDTIGFGLRQSTQRRERDVHAELENETGLDLPLLDVREAAYLVGLRHMDEVRDELMAWGYEHRR